MAPERTLTHPLAHPFALASTHKCSQELWLDEDLAVLHVELLVVATLTAVACEQIDDRGRLGPLHAAKRDGAPVEQELDGVVLLPIRRPDDRGCAHTQPVSIDHID